MGLFSPFAIGNYLNPPQHYEPSVLQYSVGFISFSYFNSYSSYTLHDITEQGCSSGAGGLIAICFCSLTPRALSTFPTASLIQASGFWSSTERSLEYHQDGQFDFWKITTDWH